MDFSEAQRKVSFIRKMAATTVRSRMSRLTSALFLCMVLLAGWPYAIRLSAKAQGHTDNLASQSAEVEEAERLDEQAAELYWNGKFVEAIPLAERVLAIREKIFGPDHPSVAVALNHLARIYHDKADLTRAEPLHRRALSIAEKTLDPSHPLIATLLSHLAKLHAHKNDLAQAEQLYQRALAIREKAFGPDHPDVGTSLYDLAGVYNDLAQAEPLLRRSLSIFEKLGGPSHPHVATVLNAIGVRYYAQGNYAQAEPLLRRALAIREKTLDPNHPFLAQSLNNMAALYDEIGDLVRAEHLYQRALSIDEKTLGPDHPGLAIDLDNLAVLYQAKGDFEQAEPHHQRALAIRERAFGPDSTLVAGSLNNLAVLYQTKGDFERAEPLLQRALSIFEKALGTDHQYVATALNSLALLYRRKGDLAKAEPLYQRAVAIDEKTLGPDHPETATTLNNLAVLYKEKGDFERAESFHQRALAIREKALGSDHPDIAQSLNNLSVLYEAKGDYARAVQLRSRGNEVEEHNLSLILATGSERQKLAYLATLSGETYTAVSLHARTAPTDPQALRLALTVVLRRKGRILDVMSNQVASLRRRLDPQDRELLDRLSSAQSQLSRLVLGGPGDTPAERHRTEVARLEGEVEFLQAAVASRSAEFRVQVTPVRVEQVRQALPQGSALVEYFSYQPFAAKSSILLAERFGPPRYVAYVLRREGDAVWADLGEAAAIDADVMRLLAALKCPQTKDLRVCPSVAKVKQQARAIDERVMRPVRNLLGDIRQVFISPDGTLNLVPFPALVDEKDRYLLENYSMTYLTSGRDLLRLQLGAGGREPPLVVADPTFDGAGPAGGAAEHGAEAAQARRSADMAQVNFRPLLGTADEAKALVALMPDARVLTQRRATEAAVKQSGGPRVLHIATHGFFLPNRPARMTGDRRRFGLANGGIDPRVLAHSENPLLRSGLALEGANLGQSAGGEDGILTALEASALDLWGTKLVVLSACETGIGEVRTGEGVYGLRRALVLAGSESQVMSLWRVSDEATRDLMVSYYRRLMAGEGRTEALRRVQMEMLDAGSRSREVAGRGGRKLSGKMLAAKAKRSHPYYWAAFIQSGDWRPIGEKK